MPVDFQEEAAGEALDFQPETLDFQPEAATEDPSLTQLFLEEASTPFVSIPKPEVAPDDPGFVKFMKGLGQTGAGLIEGLESPLGVSVLAASALPGVGGALSKAVTGAASKVLPIAGKAVGAGAGFGFGVPAFVTGLRDLYQAQQAGDPEAAGRALGNVLAGGAMQMGAVGLMKPRGAAPVETPARATEQPTRAISPDVGQTVEVRELPGPEPVVAKPATAEPVSKPVYFEDFPKNEQQAIKTRYLTELKVLMERAYPFAAKFGKEEVTVLGPARRFPPANKLYEGKPEIEKDSLQQLVQSKTGKKFITLANQLTDLVTGERLVSQTPPRRPRSGPLEGVPLFQVGKPAVKPDVAEPASAIGITPQPPKTVVESAEAIRTQIEGTKLIDEQRIKTAVAAKDVMPGRDWWASPEFEFRNDPLALPLVRKANEAELSYRHDVNVDRTAFDNFKSTLTDIQQKELTTALKDFEAGNTTTLDALPESSRQAAGAIREFYDGIRELVREDKAEGIRSSLTPAQQDALARLQSGQTFEQSTSDLRSNASKEAVRATAEELEQVSKWGIENYTTHIERGNYRVVTPEGTTVAVGRTRAEAALKADKWLKENPEVKSVTLDDEFAPGMEFPTKLSRGQYWRLISRLEESTKQDASAIQDLLHAQGSIVAVKPTNKYAAPLRKRFDVLKGEENVFDVLPLYSHIMRKKLALDPVMREARAVLPELAPNTRVQVEELLNDIKGRKTIADKIADHLLSPLGLQPFAASRGIQAAKQATTVLKLGYRPVAAAVNRLGGLQHTWVKAGSDWLAEGRRFAKTDEGKALVEANKPYIGMEASFTEASSEAPLWHPMGLFQAAERLNRPEAFSTFYRMAREGMGMDEAAAVQFARDTTRFTQFTYNLASLPRAMRGPTGRLLLQFKPYLVKELEFISTLRGQEIPRYLTAMLLMGGPRAALITLKSLPVLGALGLLDDTEDWLNQNVPRISRGVPGLLGTDVSYATAFQFPEQVSDLAGPFLSDLFKLYDRVLRPALQGEQRDFSDVQDWLVKLSPILNTWSDLVETFNSDDGWTRDWKGRVEFSPSDLDKLKLALGAKPLEKSIQEVERRYLLKTEAIERANRSRLVEDWIEAQRKGDTNTLDQLRPLMQESGVRPETVTRARRQQQLEPRQRTREQLSKPRRAEERERFQEK